MRLEFWTRFLIPFPNLSFFYLDDFVVVGKRAEIVLVSRWVDESEQRIDVKNVVLAAQDQTDPKKSWDDSSISVCMSWSRD